MSHLKSQVSGFDRKEAAPALRVLPPGEERALAQRFEDLSASWPEAIAIEDGKNRISYGDLNQLANRLARHLGTLGLGTGATVGLCLERSLEFVLGTLAILKAGHRYLLMDPGNPPERLAGILRDAGARLVLTRGAGPDLPVPTLDLEKVSLDRAEGTNLRLPSDATSTAAIIFTSGSTGQPKGVEITHQGIAHLVTATNYIQFQPEDVVGFASNTAFDASTFEIWGALLNGARLCVIPRDALLSPFRLLEQLRDRKVTVLLLTTPLFHMMAREVPTAFGGLRYLLVGGDALDPTAARLVLTSGAAPRHLINAYGPTEATTMVLFQRITEVTEEAQRIPIGEPVTGAVVHLLDEQLRPVPAGMPGELHIGGLGLARGYVNAPEETAAKFVQTPFGRLYKSGDLAQQLPDGTFDFLGRRDQQVKVRGFRIELTEIEAAIRKVIRVGECRVLAREVSPGERRIIAYFTRDRARPLPSETLRAELGKLLPEYMVPGAFIEVAGFPLTPNGKLAVDELPLVEPSQGQGDALLKSQNTLHSQLIEIWQEVLERQPVGIRDDFFDIGGHSLLAIRMLGLVEQRLGVRPELQTLFEEATIEHLAASMLTELQESGSEQPFVSIHTEGKRPPFFFLHGDFAGGGFFSRGLAEEIGTDRPFYAIHPHGFQGDPPPRSIATMADERLATIRKIQPHGPYLLGGYCNGALVAFEIARRLEAAGEQVPAVILLMASGTNYRRRHWQRLAGVVSAVLREEPAQQQQRFLQWSRKASFALAGVRDFLHASGRDQLRRFNRRIRRLFDPSLRHQPSPEPQPAEPPNLEQQFWDIYLDASESYVPHRFDGRLILLWPREEPVHGGTNPVDGWDAVCPDVQLVYVPGDHDTSITRNSNLVAAGQEMRRALDQLDLEMASPTASTLAHA